MRAYIQHALEPAVMLATTVFFGGGVETLSKV
jgi:hypothetical protein